MGDHKYNYTDLIGTFNNFESFVEQVSTILKSPVILEDSYHNILAYSNHKDVTDSIRIETIMGKRVPEVVINCLWKEGIIPALLESDNPIRVNRIEDVKLENRIAISIRNKKDVLGYIWVMEGENQLDEDALEFLSKAAKSITVYMVQYYSTTGMQQLSHQDFFWQLLLGNIKSDDEIRDNLNNMNIYPRKLCTVVIFRLLEEVEVAFHKQIINILNMTPQIQVVFHIFNKKDLIALVSIEPKDCPVHSLNRFIKLFINLVKEKIGVRFIDGVYGGFYEKYTKIESSYVQALIVLDIKEKLPNETQAIWGYSDLGIYQIINNVIEIRKKDSYENPFIKRLCEYDIKHNQRFLETLEVYLDYDCNTYETANVLHIHTNTLNYRLKRIREIGSIDLNDFNQKIGIYIDLKIQKLLNNHLTE